MLRTLLDLIFPAQCVNCRAYIQSGAICGSCRTAIEIKSDIVCVICRARLPGGRKVCHFGAPCTLGAAASYGSAVKALILALKFQGIREVAPVLAELLALYMRQAAIPAEGFVLAPVPLGPRRRLVRGYNQAELIARNLAGKTGLPLFPGLLRRVRNTPPQSELDAAGRTSNLAGAFEAAADVRNLKIILLDDVVTSGATLREAAAALRRAGARRVIALAAAAA